MVGFPKFGHIYTHDSSTGWLVIAHIATLNHVFSYNNNNLLYLYENKLMIIQLNTALLASYWEYFTEGIFVT